MAQQIPIKKFEIIQSKIFNLQSLQKQLHLWRFQSKKIVFTNGCFDILHYGHINYLSKAADSGTVLIVGVNSDSSVKKLNKGNTRPLQDEKSRATILASLSFVSAAIIFEEETPYDLIKLIQPDVLVKGGDWKPENIVGYDIVKAKGGEIISIEFVEGFSTTNIENKIRGNKS